MTVQDALEVIIDHKIEIGEAMSEDEHLSFDSNDSDYEPNELQFVFL